MDDKILEDFFNDKTNVLQTSKVLVWFKTPEGKEYLNSRLENDFYLMDRSLRKESIPDLNSERLYRNIQKNIRNNRNSHVSERIDWLAPIVKVAALILVVCTAVIFTITQEQFHTQQIVEEKPTVFKTSEKQKSQVTLSDGTTVHLNSESELILSQDFMQGKREVTLFGEAYFDVKHNEEQPFLINTNRSTVEVLGTAFNVQSRIEKDNVQVAVLEGSVSLNSFSNDDSIILSQGQFGYLDSNSGTIQVDELAVGNYMSWKSGELKFDGISMDGVCRQLSRLYEEVKCEYQTESIKNLRLTANFLNESFEKTLTVISLSLDIEFVLEGNKVFWKEKLV